MAVIVQKVIHTEKYPKGTIETIYSEEGVYLRSFIGKGQRERCYKTNIGDCDILRFAVALGYESAL